MNHYTDYTTKGLRYLSRAATNNIAFWVGDPIYTAKKHAFELIGMNCSNRARMRRELRARASRSATLRRTIMASNTRCCYKATGETKVVE